MHTSDQSKKVALVVGSTGIAGGNLAAHLRNCGWKVYGLARHPKAQDGVIPVAADLQSEESIREAVRGVEVTHVFFTTWLRQATEAENIRVNAAMVRNLLEVLSESGRVQHVALVTGLKHYLGPFEAYGKGSLPETPFRETQPRLDLENFYYAQEDEVYAAAARDKFHWSVHRPHTIIGYALGNAMNMGVTLAVYASLARVYERPFVFPGSAAQWNGLSDMTDARVLAAQLEWAAMSEAAWNQAFNVVNGDVFRWSWMWRRLADYFDVAPAPWTGQGVPLEKQMVNDQGAWKALAEKYNLIELDLTRLISAWHTDADLGRPIEVVTDMSKSRKLGFNEFRATDDCFFELFDRLRKDRIIP